MTKKEFDLMENIFAVLWKYLTISGNSTKPRISCIFPCGCPACEIEIQTTTLFDKNQGCLFCPIVHKRNDQGQFQCCNGEFSKWVKSKTIAERRKHARNILKVKWEWNDIYKKTKLKHTEADLEKILNTLVVLRDESKRKVNKNG